VLALEPSNKQAQEEITNLEKKLKPQATSESPEKHKLSDETAAKPRKKIAIHEVDSTEVTSPPQTPEKPQLASKSPSTPTTTPTTPITGSSTTTPTTAATTPTKGSKTPVRSFQLKIDIPTKPPKTSYEFETFWNSIKHDSSMVYQYLKVIPPSSYKALFQNSMNSNILRSIITVLTQHYLVDNDFKGIFDVLSNLSTISRFEMTAMFLSKQEREGITELVDKLMQQPDMDKEEVMKIKPKYGIKD